MKPNSTPRQVSSSGVSRTGSFGISANDTAHIMTILRDTLYSDKVMAVLREYSSNAWDANVEAGKPDTPIKVLLPTTMKPTLCIRDFGLGLSPDDVFKVYTQYGASTKRDSDSAVGMLGIGSKSGFAYSDSFTVVSWYGGYKRTYVAVLDASEKGDMQLLHEEECSTNETGVEIKIAVQPDDIREFHKKAELLYTHFIPRPDINLDLPEPPEATKLTHGYLAVDGHDWVAVMGCVPYRLNLDQLRGIDEGLADYMFDISGTAFFDIGEVEVSASREELKYSDKTKKAIITKLHSLVDEFVTHTLENINSNDKLTFWDKRLQAQILNRLKLPIPKEYQEFMQTKLALPTDQKKFSMFNGAGNAVTYIQISERTRVFLGDDDRKLKGFNLGAMDIIIRKVGDASLEDAKKDFEKVLEAKKLTGVKIELLSSLPWRLFPKNGRSSGPKNPKHTARLFVIDENYGSYYGSKPYSDKWKVEKRTPTDDDVFVVMERFEVDGYDFYSKYAKAKSLAQTFGRTMPNVYGYKRTAKKPIKVEDCKGTEFWTWYRNFLKSLAETPEIKKQIDLLHWANVSSDPDWRWRRRRSYGRRNYETRTQKLVRLAKNLGKKHPLTQFYAKETIAQKKVKRFKEKRYDALDKLSSSLKLEEASEARVELERLKQRYPLFDRSRSEDFSELWNSEHYEQWSAYVHLVDQHERNSSNDPTTSVHNHERICDHCLGRRNAHGEEGSTKLPSPQNGDNGGGLELGVGSPDYVSQPN